MDASTIATLLKRFPSSVLPSGNIRTCPVRLSYPNLFVPKAAINTDGSKGRETYNVALLFPLGADLRILQGAIDTAAAEKFGAAWAKRKLRMPLRDHDDRTLDDGTLPDGYVSGAKFCNASANKDHPPGVRLRDLSPATSKDIYPGCWALVTLRPYAYDNPQNKGVALGLQNVVKLCDDDRLGGGGVVSAEKEFAPIEGMDDIDAMFAAREPAGADFG